MKRILFRVRHYMVALVHVAMVMFSLLTAFQLRFDFSIPANEMELAKAGLELAVASKMLVFLAARLHRGWWRYVGIRDLARVSFANLLGSALFTGAAWWFIGPQFPRSIYLIDFLICFVVTGGARFAVRLYNEAFDLEIATKSSGKGVLIYGAGAAGRMLLKEIRSNPSLGYSVIGFLDDDPKLRSAVLMDVPVLGPGRRAAHIVDRYKRRVPKIEEIIIAMPSATGRQMREALANCRAAGVSCKTIPGIGEVLKGKLRTQIRNVSVDDLLGREQVHLEENRIQEKIADRSILITGAAGSIGSELCRQVARFRPRSLVMLDQAESELFKIDLELRDKYPHLAILPEIGDIRDCRRVDEVMRQNRVESVFHAAAYKHVPMMEAHILEAVKNNILGTWNVVQTAHRNKVPGFLMISSDKAVNPTSIMGTTKRVAELIVSCPPPDIAAPDSKFVSVRFGNVLGSNGSVVPIFQAQIAAGGPVTVTHPDVRRYFMSIREAVQLVLQASTMGKGSEIFVLDMGEPIRISDLANNMIRLAGYVPGEDIEVRFTGLRPGEKLYEELATDGENILPTYHEKIKIFTGPQASRKSIESWVAQLEALLLKRNVDAVTAHLQLLVPEYRPGGHAADPEQAPVRLAHAAKG
jgi:FlaA1/EpsC-like NDP-sugar epimerase